MVSGPRSPAARGGYALVLSLLLVLALAVLTAGMAVVAARESAIRRTAVLRVEARVRAESAVRAAIAAWSTRAAAAFAIGSEHLVTSGAGEEVRVRRLDSDLFMVTAVARDRLPAAGGPSVLTQGAAALVATLDRDRALYPAAAATMDEVARVSEGTVSGHDSCALLPPRAGLRADTAHIEGGAVVEGDPPTTSEPGLDDPLRDLPLDAIAELRPAGRVGTPRPLAAGADCLDHPWNWGSPDPAHPCAGRVPLVLVAEGLLVRGGSGQGVLIAPGDLTLAGGFSFQGLVITRGSLRIENASVSGAIRAGRLELRGGTVSFDSCHLRRALDSAPLDRAFRPPGRWWVPPF